MLTNITIGQYYPAQSIVHSLDPRFKLVSALAYMILLFFVQNFWGFIFTAACLFIIIKISRVPPIFLLRGLRGIIFILLFTAVLNVFFTAGDTELFKLFFLRVTLEGLVLAGNMAFRLILLIVGSSLLTLTTSPIELTDAIEYLMKPLKRIGVPAHEIAMMMTLALRSIPTLMEEMEKIMKAQSARGADFDTGGVIKRAHSLIPLLVPLFISSFRRADELAIAMEARCYRGDVNRTRMKALKLTRLDFSAIPLMCLYAVGIFALNRV